MRRLAQLCVFALATGVLAGRDAHGAGDAPSEIVAKGKAIAEEKCARCHAIGLEGRSTHEAAPPFREVAQRYPVENLAEALAEGIVSGHPDMPVFTFGPADIEAFLAYLDHLRASAGAGGEAPGK
jgi:mono/diheme cytochrome c family protein